MAEAMRDKIARLEGEVGRLREENETLRFVNQRLIEAARASNRATRALCDAQDHTLDALAQFTMPTIPNN